MDEGIVQPGERSCFARHLDNGLLEVVRYDDTINADATGSRYATVYLYRTELVKETRRLYWTEERFSELPACSPEEP